ncbi:unnamed protein product [Linum tenue]|uniref:Erythronate-4-phosphate dehydrogenase family protein n=1 Tax=Linum tenue TaxID=586396 RepID=A0AAV0LUA9_9ROSI|nr:unnamed protein product [Linum tenue]
MEKTSNGYISRPMENGHKVSSSSSSSLPWLDLKVLYVRVSKCEIDDSETPEYLIVNHVPLSPDALLEVNGVRTLIDSDGASTLLRRDRLDKKSEEATFVSTDNVRTTGSMKFNVFNNHTLILHGELELRNHSHPRWSMKCESDVTTGSSSSFLKPKQFMGSDSPSSPSIEVYVAGSFLGSPIILTKGLHLHIHTNRARKGACVNSIAEHDEIVGNLMENGPSNRLPLQSAESPYVQKPENEEGYNDGYRRMDYYYMEEDEDGELSWFNAGVRVGVGIGLSVCLGIGIGVGLLVRTYQGTTGNFRRRLF